MAPLLLDAVNESQLNEVTVLPLEGELRVKGEDTTHKSNVPLFTFATKTVPLQLAKQMPHESLLMTLRRFVSRRGNLRSHNGYSIMSFKAANKQVPKL
ncbi:hypothetical protein HPB48_012952 [Haemaphysalis longicornis]|uniref:Uncharacterized protein n=1 Tax=Haemaphysalis longicornis TaxID=44386 RepID=A0A9J6GGR4_HAELO|nr:hypothetical protein HPB48_012952 [Haemaphysalis longicornis]